MKKINSLFLLVMVLVSSNSFAKKFSCITNEEKPKQVSFEMLTYKNGGSYVKSFNYNNKEYETEFGVTSGGGDDPLTGHPWTKDTYVSQDLSEERPQINGITYERIGLTAANNIFYLGFYEGTSRMTSYVGRSLFTSSLICKEAIK
ncbi:MAG: hypothetical protein ACXVCY_06315 [Pseudobdellovibrionaceae bacterium]